MKSNKILNKDKLLSITKSPKLKTQSKDIFDKLF
jgi:hypothetical protein